MTHRYGRKQKALPRKRRPALSVTPSDREKEDQRHASLYCSMHSNLFSAASTFLSVFIASNCAFAVVCFSEGKWAPTIIFSVLYIISSLLSCFSVANYYSDAKHILKKIQNIEYNNQLFIINKALFKHAMLCAAIMILSIFIVVLVFLCR